MPYKVVREDITGELWGAFVGYPAKEKPRDTPYRFDEFKRTRLDMAELGFYLMYFEGIEDARMFRDEYHSTFWPLYVHECEVRVPMPAPEWIVCSWKSNTTSNMLDRVQDPVQRHHKPYPGTFMAEEIKIGRRLEV